MQRGVGVKKCQNSVQVVVEWPLFRSVALHAIVLAVVGDIRGWVGEDTMVWNPFWGRIHFFLCMPGFWWFINEAFIHSKLNLLSIRIAVHNKKCTPSENSSTHCDFTGGWPCKSGGKASMADTYYRLLSTRCILQRSYFKPWYFVTNIALTYCEKK